MRNNKIKVKPFASGVSSPGSGYDVNASTITIGQNCAGALTNPVEYSSCAFSSVKLYNRALTAAEILQNFSAHRGRFGI